MGQQPVHRGDLDLLRGQLLIAGPEFRDMSLRGGDPLQEGHAEPAGQGGGDHAAPGAVGRRYGDQMHAGIGGGRAGYRLSGHGALISSLVSSLVKVGGALREGSAGPSAGVRVPDGSTSAHTTAEPARIAAETQNPTT